MVGPVVAEHFTAPCQHRVRCVAVDDVAVFPSGEILESGIQLTREEGFFIMQVALDRIDGGWRIGLVLGIGLGDRHGMFQTGGDGQPSQVGLIDLRTRLSDRSENFHRLTILAIAGTARDEHFLQQLIIG